MSPNCQGLEQWELCHREGKSNWMDVQALSWPNSLRAPQRFRPTLPLGWVFTFTHRVCFSRSQGCS